MDALSGLIDGTRAQSALLNRAILEPPWSLRIADGAPLALATAQRGYAWIVPDDAPPALLNEGDIAVIRGSDHYTVAHQPELTPQLIVHSSGRYTTLAGVDVTDELRTSTRTCGEGSADATVIMSGTYEVSGEVSARLLSALPRVLIVPGQETCRAAMNLLAAELSTDAPGQQVVLDRMLDVALAATLRAWFDRPDAQTPGWYRAQSDPVVGEALRLIHDDPSQPWTVASLADKVGASRATFARRFTGLVGEPPMAYLTGWRIAVAGDLLRTSDATIEAIARQVGYANAFALSVAFKRVRGVSPSRHRSSHLTA
ncbi:AraC family transcriptional regulator [Phytoactinopolyspora halotolerans]|uniref:AraC family transcriptional regulator n=1 Tax=Phytoactinopolyspora halotolerans TaxID=1981512 RepID=A0A6L9S1V1_9ACTN|nr:AraC family transcriptional regulator [Phytoactinopolyspora halotolerans]NED99042.1 AraC family transcriptional regulator [Phytoactinopolyspora halotolerans]